MKRGGLDPAIDGPLHGALEHRGLVSVHAEYETAVDHDAEIVEATDGVAIVAAKVLILSLLHQVRRIQSLESNEQAAQARLNGALQKTGSQHGIHGAGGLPQAPHAAHTLEQRRREAPIAKEMVVQKI